MSNPPPALTDAQRDARARNRFFFLSIMRFAGVGLVMFGIALMVGKVPGLDGDIGRYLGFVVAVVGVFDVTILPRLLARRWKTPRAQP